MTPRIIEIATPGDSFVPRTNRQLLVRKHPHRLAMFRSFPKWEWQLIHVPSDFAFHLSNDKAGALELAKLLFPKLTAEQWSTTDAERFRDSLRPHKAMLPCWLEDDA